MTGIFATHLHELFLLPLRLPRVTHKRMGIATHPVTRRPVWTYTIEDGQCTNSMALETARAFDLSPSIIRRAEELAGMFDVICRPTVSVGVGVPVGVSASPDVTLGVPVGVTAPVDVPVGVDMPVGVDVDADSLMSSLSSLSPQLTPTPPLPKARGRRKGKETDDDTAGQQLGQGHEEGLGQGLEQGLEQGQGQGQEQGQDKRRGRPVSTPRYRLEDLVPLIGRLADVVDPFRSLSATTTTTTTAATATTATTAASARARASATAGAATASSFSLTGKDVNNNRGQDSNKNGQNDQDGQNGQNGQNDQYGRNDQKDEFGQGDSVFIVDPLFDPPVGCEGSSCVYVLHVTYGPTLPDTLYVGETESIRQRLAQHRRAYGVAGAAGVGVGVGAGVGAAGAAGSSTTTRTPTTTNTATLATRTASVTSLTPSIRAAVVTVPNKGIARQLETMLINELKRLGYDLDQSADGAHTLFNK